MKRTHEYNNNFTEYEKAIQFLEKGCECGCSKKVHSEEFAKIRANFQSLSKKEQDAVVMGQLLNTRGGKTSLSKRLKKKERVNHRTFYRWDHETPICLETYINMLGVSHTYLEYVRNHLLIKGLSSRIHSNTGKVPQRKTKIVIDQRIKKTVKNFLENYAEKYGLPDPGRTKRITKSIIFLSTEMSYASVRLDFLKSLEKDDKLRQLKYDVFRRLWHELTPNIKFRSPRSDLCDTCQQFHRDLQNPCLSKEAKELKKKNFFNT